MKYKIIITILLFIFSLYYLDKAAFFIRENDTLMQEIREKQIIYNTPSINAIITNKTMIPGKIGKRVNLKKSYQKMKKINAFSESLLVFDTITPKKTIQNTYDKIILFGNKQQNKITIILEIDNDFLFNALNKILASFNLYLDISTTYQYHLENTNYQNIVTKDYFSFTDYCLTYNLSISPNCTIHKKYTVLGHYINNYYLLNTKEIISNGTILVYHFNENNYKELSLLLKYFKNNNYQVVNIRELIQE